MELTEDQWKLMARVLSREASADERKAFDQLLILQPAIGFLYHQLQAVWVASAATQTNSSSSHAAVARILQKAAAANTREPAHPPTSFLIRNSMFKNNFKIAFRNLVRNKAHAFINISGLSIGMAVALLIGLWIWDELSYNKQYPAHDRIVQVMQNQTFDGEVKTTTSQPRQLSDALRAAAGEDFKSVVLASGSGKHTLSYSQKNLGIIGNFMEPGAADMLSLQMKSGTHAGLVEPGSILLSQSTATALFGAEDPVNQLMKIDNKMDVKVTGVYADLPRNSSFGDLAFLAPWKLLEQSEKFESRQIGWGNTWFQVYALLNPNTDLNRASERIRKITQLNDPESRQLKPELFLYPMDRWYLYSEFRNGLVTGGPVKYLWLLGTIGVFVLLLACINFMNLSTARSEKRSKEVGIRKAIGSSQRQLVAQFFSESLVVAGLAFALSLLLIFLILPWFNSVAGKEVAIPWSSSGFWFIGLGFTAITGLLAGTYPALYLSSFKPISVLKGSFRAGRSGSTPRRAWWLCNSRYRLR